MLKNIIFVVIGTLFGIVLLVIVRFAVLKDTHVHFHSNFLIYIDGKKVDFSDDKYMEEVSACSENGYLQPRQRAHMHDGKSDLIHIHDDGVTWGNFLANLGFNLNSNVLIDDNGNIYQTEGSKALKFILNGQSVNGIDNRLINNEDKLLINFGSESVSDLVSSRFNEVPNSATEANKSKDPASCGGSGSPSFLSKLKKSFF